MKEAHFFILQFLFLRNDKETKKLYLYINLPNFHFYWLFIQNPQLIYLIFVLNILLFPLSNFFGPLLVNIKFLYL